MPPTLIDAARLAALAPPGGILPPMDESTELAYLDLRDDLHAVAASKAQAVAAAFGPSLYLRATLRLVIATGELSPTKVARSFAGVAAPDPQASAGRIAVVRGEDVLDRLEELMLAGCDLGVTDKPPVAAWAPTPARILREAVATGASVVVSRFAMPDEVSTAVEAESGGEPIGLPASRPVGLVFPNGFGLRVDVDPNSGLSEAISDLPDTIRELGDIELAEHAQFTRLDVRAADLSRLLELAQRLELAAPSGMFHKPLIEAIVPSHQKSTASVPTELLEFGVDVRPAGDW